MRTILLLVFLALFGCNTSKTDAVSDEQPPQEVKTLSDEEIIAIINENSKFEFTDDDLCIERPLSFEGLALIGYFAHDRGCRGDDAIYDGKLVKINEITSRVLKDAGWDQEENMEQLALDWVDQVMLIWSSLITTEPDDFNENDVQGFHKPTVENKDDFIIVKCWVKKPSGMMPQAEYYQLEVHFQKSDASIHKMNSYNHVTIDY